MIRKGITLIVMLLLLCISFTQSTGNIILSNKIIPFGVTISFDPSEPNGNNGWYVTYVTVIFTADNDTVIESIKMRFDGDPWQMISNNYEIWFEGNHTYNFLVIDSEGFEYYFGPYDIKIDTLPPVTDEIYWEAYEVGEIWYIDFIASAIDDISGMDRVECFIEDDHYETIEGAGPYIFTVKWCQKIWGKWIYFYYYDKAGNEIVEDIYIPEPELTSKIIGLIFNPIIINQSVEFFVILARYIYINDYGITVKDTIMFQRFTIPNDYKGYMGRFFIYAFFTEWHR